MVYDDAVPVVELHQDLRNAVRDLCKAFPDSYWRELDAALLATAIGAGVQFEARVVVRGETTEDLLRLDV